MPEPSADMYQREWEPRLYLRQYYSTPHLPDDCQAVIDFLNEQLPARPGGYASAVEFGCGPTLYAALAMAPHVRQLHLSDYLQSNLEEVRRWLNHEPGAHDWRVYVRAILEREGGQRPMPAEIAGREAVLRQKVVGLHQVDIRSSLPFGSRRTFDLVGSFFCIEAVSSDREEWSTYLEHLSSTVAPGGNLLLASVRQCRGYEVLGRMFPAAYVDEADFLGLLPRFGFDEGSLVVHAVPIKEWAAEGFDSICLVAASKLSSDRP